MCVWSGKSYVMLREAFPGSVGFCVWSGKVLLLLLDEAVWSKGGLAFSGLLYVARFETQSSITRS